MNKNTMPGTSLFPGRVGETLIGGKMVEIAA
jgi:hypothetical protein